MKTQMRIRIIVAALALTLVAGPGAIAAVLFNQPYDGSGNLFASQNDTNGLGNFATVYDNFTLGAASTIDNVMWTGGYFNPPAQGPITAFTIQFWSDAAGQPGGSLATFNIAGNASEMGSDPIYTYSLDLGGMGFMAAPGTQYWMSIVPDLGFPPQWGWATSAVGDGIAFQDFFGGRSQVAADFAFTLNGAPKGVPESGSTVVLLGGVFIALGLLRRRIRATS
jgi:hypothetical protein